MLQAKEFSFLKDHNEIRCNISLHALAEQGSGFFLYLLSPEDSSAGSGAFQNATYMNRHHTLIPTCKVLFWFTVSLTFAAVISKIA